MKAQTGITYKRELHTDKQHKISACRSSTQSFVHLTTGAICTYEYASACTRVKAWLHKLHSSCLSQRPAILLTDRRDQLLVIWIFMAVASCPYGVFAAASVLLHLQLAGFLTHRSTHMTAFPIRTRISDCLRHKSCTPGLQ